MPGFFPHLATTRPGYTSLGSSTFDNILSDIVTDVGAGNNGWTLDDDQRTPVNAPVWVPVRLTWTGAFTNYWIAIGNGTTAITGGTAMQFVRRWIPTVTQILKSPEAGTSGTTPSWPADGTAVASYSTVDAVASNSAATAGGNGNANTALTACTQWFEVASGYIVLKYTAQNANEKTFYVRIWRQKSYGDVLRVATYETWNNSTHTGTNPSAQCNMRAYSINRGAGTDIVEYVLWLLPNTFGLWAGGEVAHASTLSDFYYAGLLETSDNDLTALIAGGSDAFSGTGLGVSTTSSHAGLQILKDYSGSATWLSSTQMFSNSPETIKAIGVMLPSVHSYVRNPNRPWVNAKGKVQITPCYVWAANRYGMYYTHDYAYRGKVRYLRQPCANPSGRQFYKIGPDGDGHSYILVRVTPPYQSNVQTLVVDEHGATPGVTSSFGANYHPFTQQALGDVGVTSAQDIYDVPLWFLMPTDV